MQTNVHGLARKKNKGVGGSGIKAESSTSNICVDAKSRPAHEKLPNTSRPQDQRGLVAGTRRVLFWRHTGPALVGLCMDFDMIKQVNN